MADPPSMERDTGPGKMKELMTDHTMTVRAGLEPRSPSCKARPLDSAKTWVLMAALGTETAAQP